MIGISAVYDTSDILSLNFIVNHCDCEAMVFPDFVDLVIEPPGYTIGPPSDFGGVADGEIFPDRISSCSITDVTVEEGADYVYIDSLDGSIKINGLIDDVGESFDDTVTVTFSEGTQTDITVTGEIVAICDVQIVDRTEIFSFEPVLGQDPSSWIIGKAATSSDYEYMPEYCEIGIEVVGGLDNDLFTVRRSDSFPDYLVLEIAPTDDSSLLDVAQDIQLSQFYMDENGDPITDYSTEVAISVTFRKERNLCSHYDSDVWGLGGDDFHSAQLTSASESLIAIKFCSANDNTKLHFMSFTFSEGTVVRQITQIADEPSCAWSCDPNIQETYAEFEMCITDLEGCLATLTCTERLVSSSQAFT